MRLRFIYTGGTIGSAGDPLAPLAPDAFRARWEAEVAPRLGLEADLGWSALEPPIESAEATPADWARLAAEVLASAGDEAVVVLHGTDTMAWTAAALAFLLTEVSPEGAPRARFDRPVVLVGAMRPLFRGDGLDPESDGLANIGAAINAALSGRRGVTVVSGATLMHGTRVMKMSSSDVRAFGYPRGTGAPAPLPAAEPAALRDQLAALTPHLGTRAVVTLTASPNDPALQEAQLASLVEGLGPRLGALHLAGYGTGNFPARERLGPLLARAMARGVLVVAGSQVPHGRVEPGLYAAGRWLVDLGALSSADMTAAAVHAKLHLILAMAAARGWDAEAAGRFFLTPLAGEIQP